MSNNILIPETNELEVFQRTFGKFGEREIRSFDITSEVRDSGAGPDVFTITGHASVFERESLDLGGFTEFIAPEAFTHALNDPNLDVHALWDHDTRYVLGRTPKTLDLQQDEIGLRYWARVVPTSYAADLRLLMEAGAIDQASFAFTVKSDEWRITEDESGEERVIRTILEVDRLFDVTVCARGAYPQASSNIVRSYVLDHARTHIPEEVVVEEIEEVTEEPVEEVVRKATPVQLAKAKAKARRHLRS